MVCLWQDNFSSLNSLHMTNISAIYRTTCAPFLVLVNEMLVLVYVVCLAESEQVLFWWRNHCISSCVRSVTTYTWDCSSRNQCVCVSVYKEWKNGRKSAPLSTCSSNMRRSFSQYSYIGMCVRAKKRIHEWKRKKKSTRHTFAVVCACSVCHTLCWSSLYMHDKF